MYQARRHHRLLPKSICPCHALSKPSAGAHAAAHARAESDAQPNAHASAESTAKPSAEIAANPKACTGAYARGLLGCQPRIQFLCHCLFRCQLQLHRAPQAV